MSIEMQRDEREFYRQQADDMRPLYGAAARSHNRRAMAQQRAEAEAMAAGLAESDRLAAEWRRSLAAEQQETAPNLKAPIAPGGVGRRRGD
jgi:hypothetical protein